VPAWPSKELFAEQLELLGCGERARNLVAQVKELGSEKRALLLAVVYALDLPLSTFRTSTFNDGGATR